MYLWGLRVVWACYEALLVPIAITGRSTSSIIFRGELGETSAEYAVLVNWVPVNRRAFGLRRYMLLDSLPAVASLRWRYSLTVAGNLFASGQLKLDERLQQAWNGSARWSLARRRRRVRRFVR